MRCYRYLVSAVILVVALTMLIVPAPATADEPTATLELVPEYTQNPTVGGTFDVTVRGLSDIYTAGYEIWLQYDATYIEPVEVVYGPEFKDLKEDPEDPPTWIKDNGEGLMGVFGMVPLNEEDDPFVAIEWVTPDSLIDLCTVTYTASWVTPPEGTPIALLVEGTDNPLFPGHPEMVTGVYGTSDITLPSPPAQQFLEPVEVRPGIASLNPAIGSKGDFEGNRCIELYDFVEFASAFGSQTGDPNYSIAGDFDDDGEIGLYDFVEFAGVFGTCY